MRVASLVMVLLAACSSEPPPAPVAPVVVAPPDPVARPLPADLPGLGQLEPQDLAATVAAHIAWTPHRGTWKDPEATLASRRGSHVERAELILAALRATGKAARMALGPLDSGERDALIERIYPGVLPDARLLAAVTEHAWVEVKDGERWVTVDPLRPGQFRMPARTSEGVPGDQVHVAQVTWMREAGAGPERIAETVGPIAELSRSGVVFRSAPPVTVPDLLDKPAVPDSAKQVLGIDPSAGATSAETLIEPPKPPPSNPSAGIPGWDRGATPIEVGAAPGSTTREWLVIRLEGPDGAVEVQRPIWDAATPGEPVPPWRRVDLAFTGDLVEMARIESSVRSPDFAPAAWRQALESGDPEKVVAAGKAVGVGAQVVLQAMFAGQDRITTRSAAHAGVVVVPDRPRVAMMVSTAAETPGGVGVELALDYALDAVHAVPRRPAPAAATRLFQAARGLGSSAWEGALLRRLGGAGSSAPTVFASVAAAGVEVGLAKPEDRAALDAATWLSPADRARVSAALDAGRQVLLPTALVVAEGPAPVAWYEVDLGTGAWTGVIEGGWHGTFEISLIQGKAGDKEAGAALGLMAGGSMAHALGSLAILMFGEIDDEMFKEIEGLINGMACASCPKLAAKVDLDLTMGGCIKTSWFVDAKLGVEVKPSDFCDAYADGIRCAAGLVLKDMRGEGFEAPTPGDFNASALGLDCDGVE